MRPERDRLRWLPLEAALVTALLVGVVATVTTLAALRMEAPIERERAAGQGAVLDLLGEEIGRAVALGIPLDALPDLPPHLETTLGQFPGLSAVTIEMPGGFRAAVGSAAADDIPRDVTLGDGTLTLYRAPDSRLRRTLVEAAAAITLAAAAGAAALAWLVVTRPARRAETALAARLDAVARGDFAAPPVRLAGLPAEAVAADLEEWRARVVQRRKLLEQQAAGLRAIDFDGTIGPQVDAILARADAGRRMPDAAG